MRLDPLLVIVVATAGFGIRCLEEGKAAL